MSDEIPTIGEHRGVRIHAFQPQERIERIVKPAIDAVHAMTDVAELFDYAIDPWNPPEARLFASAKCRAAHGLASASRVARPDIDLEKLQAHVVGLDSLRWLDPSHYGSLLCVRSPELWGTNRRPPEFKEQILALKESRLSPAERKNRQAFQEFRARG